MKNTFSKKKSYDFQDNQKNKDCIFQSDYNKCGEQQHEKTINTLKKNKNKYLNLSKYNLPLGYYCEPCLQNLNSMNIFELCQIEGFVIGNEYGEIRFLQPVDLSEICLEKAFDIQRNIIEVYPQQYYDTETSKRYFKRGLNRQAILIYKNFFKKAPKKSFELEKKLTRKCMLKGLDFVQIDYDSNELWDETFQVLLNQEEANFIKKILPPGYFLNQVPKAGKNKYLISSEALLSNSNKIKDNKLSQNSGPYKKCQKILNGLKQHKNAEPFLEPVDPIALGIPTYFDIIKNPMDLSSVETKFRGNRYKSPYQFFKDIELIWSNAFLFNLPETEVYQMCEDIQQEYLVLKRREFGDKLERENKLKEQLAKFKRIMNPQEKEEETKYLEDEEFVQLAANIKKLPNQYIYGVIEIIQLYHPEYNFNQCQEINLESLSDIAMYQQLRSQEKAQ